MVGGCSIYPLPQDVSGADTKAIVDNIRCEARMGLQETALKFLDSYFADVKVWRGKTGAELASTLRQYPSEWDQLRIDDLSPSVKPYFAFYRNSQIAYEFDLTMEEDNNDTLGLGFKKNFFGASKRMDTLGLSLGSDRTRKVERIFNTVDTFEELVLKVSSDYCNKPRHINIVYPITGSLPIRDLMLSYIEINQFEHLAGGGTDLIKIFGTKTTPAVPQMGDTITFTTKLSGEANPITAVTPVPPSWLLSSVNFDSKHYRSDTHKVLIVVSTSQDAAKASRLDARRATPIYAGSLFGTTPLPPVLPPIKNGELTQSRADFARSTLDFQRQRALENAITNGLGELAQSLR